MLATCMTTPTALDSFIDKWRSRWPEWSVAEVFMAPDRRERSLAWFALLQEFEDILNVAGDPLPADAKLGWWASELRDWQGQRSRHPLGRLLEPLPAPWALLADALPSLVAARERPRDGDAALAALTAYTGAVAEVEAVVLGGSRAAPAALAAQVLAGRLAAAGTVALPLVLEPGSAAAPEAAAEAVSAEVAGFGFCIFREVYSKSFFNGRGQIKCGFFVVRMNQTVGHYREVEQKSSVPTH